jgi:hypothetical protein
MAQEFFFIQIRKEKEILVLAKSLSFFYRNICVENNNFIFSEFERIKVCAAGQKFKVIIIIDDVVYAILPKAR